MNFVEPIRDKKQLAHVKHLLKGQGRARDLLLFVVGINTALRISDLLHLRIGDFLDENGQVKTRFSIREEKRGKRHEVIVNDSIREALKDYLKAYPDVTRERTHFMFFSTTSRRPMYTQPLTRGQAWKWVSAICHDAGLRGNFGTHTLRKTWGYHARRQGVDIALIMTKLNHSNLAYTKRYLGITDDELQAVIKRLNL